MSRDWFIGRAEMARELEGKTIALVGSGPGALGNPPGLIDSHDVVVRVNNYRLFPATGFRTDVFYSYFGGSIKKTAKELMRDGVRLCIAKCPDAQFMDSDWHSRHGKMNGVDFRIIYSSRTDWWFCPTYIPTVDEFLKSFELLGRHVPTTGFAAILDVLACKPKHLYVTGFDFFRSGIHNVNERWRKINHADPIGHVPELERAWFVDNFSAHPITMDQALTECIHGKSRVIAK